MQYLGHWKHRRHLVGPLLALTSVRAAGVLAQCLALSLLAASAQHKAKPQAPPYILGSLYADLIHKMSQKAFKPKPETNTAATPSAYVSSLTLQRMV